MLSGSLVELLVGLHSCLCFSHLEKLLFKAGSTPPQYLLNSQLFVELPKLFSYRNLACTSISGESIEIRSVCLIASQHLVDRSKMFLPPRQLLDTSRSIEILLHALFFTCFAYFLLSLCPQHLLFLFLVGLWFLVLFVPSMSVFCFSLSCLLAFYAL